MWEKFDIALAASVARRAVTVKNAGYLRYTLCRHLFDQPFEQYYTCSCSANKTHTSHSVMSSNLSTCPSPGCAGETSGKEPLPQLKVVHKTTRQHAHAFVAPPLPAVQARPQAKRHAQTTATCPTHMFGCRPRPTKTSLHPPTWLRSRGARRAPAAPAAYRSRQHPTTAWSGGYRADRTVAGGVSAEGLACLLGAVLHVCGCV